VCRAGVHEELKKNLGVKGAVRELGSSRARVSCVLVHCEGVRAGGVSWAQRIYSAQSTLLMHVCFMRALSGVPLSARTKRRCLPVGNPREAREDKGARGMWVRESLFVCGGGGGERLHTHLHNNPSYCEGSNEFKRGSRGSSCS